jgi:hypothetical protein
VIKDEINSKNISCLLLQVKDIFLPLHHVSHKPKHREMAERSNAAVLKTVVGQPTGGSNPSLSAQYSSKKHQNPVNQIFTGFFVVIFVSKYA